MHESYDDIRDRILEPPTWFDENAVPRYCTFDPRRLADIYADEAVLAEITCQGCGAAFKVAFSVGSMERITWSMRTGKKPHEMPRLADAIRGCSLHYGDPPNVGCCAAGPTMNSEPRRVLEYWHRHDREHVDADGTVTDVASYMDWHRDPMLEVVIEPEWVAADD